MTGTPSARGNLIRLPPPPGVVRAPSRPRKVRQSDDGDLWLVSFSDMLMLLFCFVVLLLSVSGVDPSRMDRLRSTIDQQFGEGNRQGLDSLQQDLVATIRSHGLDQQVKVKDTPRGLVLLLDARILFSEASADLSEPAKGLLDIVLSPVKGRKIHVLVEGHTDPMAIQTALFPSNWELSSARAAAVVRYMIQDHGFSPTHLEAVGLADTRPVNESGEREMEVRPRAAWTEAYLARQRRVELVMVPDFAEEAGRAANSPR